MRNFLLCITFCVGSCLFAQKTSSNEDVFVINDQEYLEKRGANVMLAHDFYPESHQGGVGIIQNGIRVATNGDLRLEPTPGQWQPVPKVGKRKVDLKRQSISVQMQYPDDDKKTGFNPIVYPDLELKYSLRVEPSGKSFKIIVDLENPLPKKWLGKVGMNIEFFPAELFGKSYYMDEAFGIFPRQLNGPGFYDTDGNYQIKPMAKGNKLVVAPENSTQTIQIENLRDNQLELIDGRAQHNNGWFVVRSLIQENKTKNAIEWLVTPSTDSEYMYKSVVQVSQVGYHPKQEKIAIIETDKRDDGIEEIHLLRVNNTGGFTAIKSVVPTKWGPFLRYQYYQFDFSEVEKPGMYVIRYKDQTTHSFQINESVLERNVWQSTLECFLPVQMCHMRVNDRYKVWHGRCHLDDARMAPVNTNHFDGYEQGESTLSPYKSGEIVSGLNVGGWHDAGDYDLRIESQAATIEGLSQIYELFDVSYDNTTIDQENKVVELFQPDGKPDILQQIEHGALTIVAGYKALHRFYRGIIVPTNRQYVLLGDPLNHSDNIPFAKEGSMYQDVDNFYEKTGNSMQFSPNSKAIEQGLFGAPDDRWVFTENNLKRSYQTAASLAVTYRALKNYNSKLAEDCLSIAKEVWEAAADDNSPQKINLAIALFQSTKLEKYSDFLVSEERVLVKGISKYGWKIGPVLSSINDEKFQQKIKKSVGEYFLEIEKLEKETPYGVPYKPNIWGAGWGIQHFGVEQYYLHTSYPDIFDTKYMINAMNFILGVHPGVNTSSFASGVGVRSITQAYGVNRGEFSYIPGGIGSGTALIRPDFPELLEWPFLWQQTEYVLGGGTTDYMFLILAANALLNR